MRFRSGLYASLLASDYFTRTSASQQDARPISTPVNFDIRFEKALAVHEAGSREGATLFSNQDYRYGDVLRNLYGPEFQALQDKTLDAREVCAIDMIKQPTVEGWLSSGAGPFIRAWIEASNKTRGFEAHAAKMNFDFRQKFLNDVVYNISPLKCHIHETCVTMTCEQVIENLIVPDPAIAMAVLYTDKQMIDLMTVTHAQLELLDHANEKMNLIAKELVEKFTWREDKSINERCKAQADSIIAAIQTTVMAIAIIGGAAAPVIEGVTGAISRSTHAAMGVGKSKQIIGSGAKELTHSERVFNSIGLFRGGKIPTSWKEAVPEVAEQVPGAISVGAIATNAELFGSWQRKGLKPGGLAEVLCRNKPQVEPGSDKANLQHLLNQISVQLSAVRKNTEYATTALKEDLDVANTAWRMGDYLEAGAFYLSDAAGRYYSDNREDAREKLTAYLRSVFVMATLQSAGSGVHCSYRAGGCSDVVEDSIYCVTPNVACQAFSWLPWDKHQYKVPHWGHRFLNTQEARDVYGFDTKVLVEKSWEYYTKKAFAPGWGGDLLNTAYQMMGEEFSQLAPVHLPVCYDNEGIWELGHLGTDPTGPDKHENQDKFPSHFPCSCGKGGSETEAFMYTTGLATVLNIPHVVTTCIDQSRNSDRYNRAPWNFYQTFCNMWSISDNFYDDHPLDGVILGPGRDPWCADNIATHDRLIYESKYTPIQAACEMCASDRIFAESRKGWDELENRCAEFVVEKQCYKSNKASYDIPKKRYKSSKATCSKYYWKKTEGEPHDHDDQCKDKFFGLPTCDVRDKNKHPMPQLVELSKRIPDNRTYVSNEQIMAFDQHYVWYEAVPTRIDRTPIPRTGRQVKEDMRRMNEMFGKKDECASLALEENGHHYLLHVDWFVGLEQCEGVCDGQGPNPPLVSSGITENDKLEGIVSLNMYMKPEANNNGDIPTCAIPKPWLDESISQECIQDAARFYLDKKLPKVKLYGFNSGSDTSMNTTTTLPQTTQPVNSGNSGTSTTLTTLFVKAGLTTDLPVTDEDFTTDLPLLEKYKG